MPFVQALNAGIYRAIGKKGVRRVASFIPPARLCDTACCWHHSPGVLRLQAGLQGPVGAHTGSLWSVYPSLHRLSHALQRRCPASRSTWASAIRSTWAPRSPFGAWLRCCTARQGHPWCPCPSAGRSCTSSQPSSRTSAKLDREGMKGGAQGTWCSFRPKHIRRFAKTFVTRHPLSAPRVAGGG